jgi:hypothetical protein
MVKAKVTNTLAYCDVEIIMTVKGFKAQAHGAHFINIVSAKYAHSVM